MAENEFDAFLTTEKGILHQQNLSNIGLVVVLLRAKSNDYADLVPLMGETVAALTSAAPGAIVLVPSDE